MKSTIIILFSLCYTSLTAQDTITATKKFTINGYVKGLETFAMDKINHSNTTGSLIHNRLNLKWKLNPVFSFTTELRNRIFFGEIIKTTPNFSESLRNPNEAINLQKAWINNNDLVFHTNIERLYVDWKQKRWTTRIGRQRINWGMATTWNPNDLYNAYNFLDVDYEERPGADAINIQYQTSGFSHLEFVFSDEQNNKGIAAARYFINKWNYDLQFIAGSYKGNATIGAGWAGNIKEAGFKGELQYYFNDIDSLRQLNFTVGVDYMFKKGWYVDGSFLYNSLGLNHAVQNWTEVNLNLSSKNLMPGKYNFILSGRKTITSLFISSCSVVYTPGLDLLILMPGITYNISSQLDADIIWQSFYLNTGSVFKQISDVGYLRLKWSF